MTYETRNNTFHELIVYRNNLLSLYEKNRVCCLFSCYLDLPRGRSSLLLNIIKCVTYE